MRIAGVDPSLTNTGLAVFECSQNCNDCDCPVERCMGYGLGVKCCPDCRHSRRARPHSLHSIGWGEEGGKSWLDRNRRGRDLASAVCSWLVQRSPDLVLIELPIPRGLNRASQPDLWWLFNLLLAELTDRRIDCVMVNPRTRQAWATGNGNAGKPEILAEVRTWWEPVKVLNADIADAIVLASMGALRYGYELPAKVRVKPRHWTPLLEKVIWPASAPPAPEQPTQLELLA